MQKLGQLATLTMRRDIRVGETTASVIIAEGAAQVVWHAGGPATLAGRSFFNDFVHPGMADQLRALADAVDEANDLTSSL